MHRQKQNKQPAETNSSMATQDEITKVATVLAELLESDDVSMSKHLTVSPQM